MAIESWAPVPQTDLYASSMGRIMVDPRESELPNGGIRIYGGQPTTGQWDGKRFVYARRGHKTLKVHRLVCEAFNGPANPGQVCMHLDEDASNNKPENLAWGSQKENLNAAGFIEYCKSRTGDQSPVVKGRAAQQNLTTERTL